MAFAGLADHVIVLDEHCNVIEQGAPHDLLQNQTGQFSRLYSAAKEDLSIV
jgi:ABC-type multidrug transport system fused ATPase/permease subunit